MQIEIGKTYRDGWGREHKVQGFTKFHTDIVYTVGGFWFYLDGRQHYDGRVDRPTNYDLKEEVTETFDMLTALKAALGDHK